MRIAIIGSHGVGKTTLSVKISNYFGFARIPDIVREAHEKKFVINEETPPESQFWILSKQIELERNTPESWIADKTLFDNIIYGNVILKDQKVKDVISDIVIKEARYDAMLYLPIEFAIADDGLRSLNNEFQAQIDRSYIEFLNQNNFSYYTVRGTIEERFQQALQIIEPLLRPSSQDESTNGLPEELVEEAII